MEKDFKKEYSEHMKSETPDLWSRIESGLTEKTPSKVISMEQTKDNTSDTQTAGKKADTRAVTYRWKRVMPAAAAVLLLLVAAPIVAPRVMEKTSDMAIFDAKMEAENAMPTYEIAMDEAYDAGLTVEAEMEESVIETKTENEMPQEETDNMVSSGNAATASGSTGENSGAKDTGETGDADKKQEYGHEEKQDSETIVTNDSKETGDTDEYKYIEIKVLHCQVLEQTQDMNLLAIDKEHIDMVCDLYLIVVDGEEKILAVLPTEEEVAFEPGMWYDLTVTDGTEYGIDYVWVK